MEAPWPVEAADAAALAVLGVFAVVELPLEELPQAESAKHASAANNDIRRRRAMP